LDRFTVVLADFFESIPLSLDLREWESYARAIGEFRIDNFGSLGTGLLLSWMGVPAAPPTFRERALQGGFLPRLGRLTADVRRGDGTLWRRTRVISYIEYNVEGPSGRIQGQEPQENAYQGEAIGDSRWLRATNPSLNPFADRRTCSEFRFFDNLIERMAHVGMVGDELKRGKVHGDITMAINCPPCVSCIGVVR